MSCYSPTNARDEKDPYIFYNERSSLVRSILKHVLINGGDMDVQIGKNENNEFSLHNWTLCNKRDPTNVNAQKLKKAQNELTNAYVKEQTILSKPDQ